MKKTLSISPAWVLILVLLTACATAPLTGRQQLNLISQPTLTRMGLKEYRRVLEKSKLSSNQKQTAEVKRVGGRIAKAAEEFMRRNGMTAQIRDYNWEFNLIEDDDQINAWCMPGGKVAVYTGIMPVARDETGLAVILGHEAAHALARHGNERMSQALLTQMGGMALSMAVTKQPAATQQLFMTAYGLTAQVGVLLPYSRQQELEADRIGLTITALAGYDPREAVDLWRRMKAADKNGAPPAFLATHPAPDARIKAIKRYIPEAMRHYSPGAE